MCWIVSWQIRVTVMERLSCHTSDLWCQTTESVFAIVFWNKQGVLVLSKNISTCYNYFMFMGILFSIWGNHNKRFWGLFLIRDSLASCIVFIMYCSLCQPLFTDQSENQTLLAFVIFLSDPGTLGPDLSQRRFVKLYWCDSRAANSIPTDNANRAIQANVSRVLTQDKWQNSSQKFRIWVNGGLSATGGVSGKSWYRPVGMSIGMSPTGRDGAVHLLREESVDLLSTRKRKEQACKARS